MEAARKDNIMAQEVENSRLGKRVGWQEVCPTCLKYDNLDRLPECEHCKENGVTEGILCELTRMDQENDPDDFQCGAYQRKSPLE